MATKTHLLEREQVVPRPLEEVFAFFSDAGNLATITPGFLGFHIVTPVPIAMRAGTLIDYRIRVFGLPRRRRTLIESFDPPRAFVDVQLAGPYRKWRHTHLFEAIPGGTRMRDRVEYALPFGPLGEIAHRILVRPMLERIFDYRREKILALFGSAERG